MIIVGCSIIAVAIVVNGLLIKKAIDDLFSDEESDTVRKSISNGKEVLHD